jgi:hypothetical protein
MTLVLDFHLLTECDIEKEVIVKLFERNDYFNSVKQIVEEQKFWLQKHEGSAVI